MILRDAASSPVREVVASVVGDSIPANAVYYNGDPVYYDGEVVTYEV